jgi:hypothetical protein
LLRLSAEQPAFYHLRLQLGIWLVFVLGAILGVGATLRWGLLSLVGPIVCLALVAVCDVIRPIFPPREGAGKPEWT